MKTIKFWYFMCLVLFGKMSQEQVSILLDVYNSYELYKDRTLKWNLSGVKKGKAFPKIYLYRILHFWFGSYVPNKDLLKKVLENGLSTLLYLESAGKRYLDWENYEQEAVLSLKADKLRHLSKPLSPKFEERLIDEAKEDKLERYLQKFVLSLSGEFKLCRKVAACAGDERDKCDYHYLACLYVREHKGKAFAKAEVQQLLFELPDCEDVQKALIEQSTMLTSSLKDVAIETLIDEAEKYRTGSATKLLKLFLSLSYIENEALIEKIQKVRLDEHVVEMFKVSKERLKVTHHLAQYGYGLSLLDQSPYLYSTEKEIMSMPNNESRYHAIKKHIVPKFETGEVTPACAAWVVLNCMNCAPKATEGIHKFERRVIDNIILSEMFGKMMNHSYDVI